MFWGLKANQSRSNAEKKKIKVDQPMKITKYNAYMVGVDRLDQNVGAYHICKKW